MLEVEKSYPGMRRRARHVLQGFPGVRSLQPTAVVHEALIKIWRRAAIPSTRKEFMLAVSSAMRDVLIDNLRKKKTQKRGGGSRGTSLEGEVASVSRNLFANKVRVQEALEELRERHPRIAFAVEMRFFGGFTMREIAAEQRVSKATTERDVANGRALLYALLCDD